MTLSIASYAQLDSLVMRGGDDDGWIVLEGVTGWGSPASTLSPQQKPSSHGAWAGGSWLAPRNLALSGVLGVDDPARLSYLEDSLHDAVSLDPVLLTVVEEGRARWCMVRRTDEVLTQRLSRTETRWSAQVVALDPRKYGAQQSVSTALPSSSGGLVFPVAFPVTFDSVTVSGQVTIDNDGNIEAPLTVRFDGPLIGPKIVHVQTQRAWAAAGAVIGAGEFWTVQLPSLEARAQGQASRSGYVTERGRLELLPGPNDFVFSADAYDPASLMTVTASSAWK